MTDFVSIMSIKDIFNEVIQYVHNNYILNLFSCNKYFHEFCSDQNFWLSILSKNKISISGFDYKKTFMNKCVGYGVVFRVRRGFLDYEFHPDKAGLFCKLGDFINGKSFSVTRMSSEICIFSGKTGSVLREINKSNYKIYGRTLYDKNERSLSIIKTHRIVLLDVIDSPIYFSDFENNIIYIKNEKIHFLMDGKHKIYDINSEDINQLSNLRCVSYYNKNLLLVFSGYISHYKFSRKDNIRNLYQTQIYTPIKIYSLNNRFLFLILDSDGLLWTYNAYSKQDKILCNIELNKQKIVKIKLSNSSEKVYLMNSHHRWSIYNIASGSVEYLDENIKDLCVNVSNGSMVYLVDK